MIFKACSMKACVALVLVTGLFIFGDVGDVSAILMSAEITGTVIGNYATLPINDGDAFSLKWVYDNESTSMARHLQIDDSITDVYSMEGKWNVVFYSDAQLSGTGTVWEAMSGTGGRGPAYGEYFYLVYQYIDGSFYLDGHSGWEFNYWFRDDGRYSLAISDHFGYETRYMIDVTINIDSYTHGNTVPIPEPSTLVLLGAGLLGLISIVRRRNLKPESDGLPVAPPTR